MSFLLLDATGNRGMRADNCGSLMGTADGHMGPCQPDLENFNDTLLANRPWLHNLSAVDTFVDVVPSAAALATSAALMKCSRQFLSTRCGIVQVMRFSSFTQIHLEIISQLLFACSLVCLVRVDQHPDVLHGTMMPSIIASCRSYMVNGDRRGRVAVAGCGYEAPCL